MKILSGEAILGVISKERERQSEFGYEAGDIDISHEVAQAQLEYTLEQVVELFEDDQTITYAQGHPVINFNSFEAKWLGLVEQVKKL